MLPSGFGVYHNKKRLNAYQKEYRSRNRKKMLLQQQQQLPDSK